MAHFAKITEDNKVLAVLAVNDKDTKNSDGIETELVGQSYLEKVHHWPAHLWIKTSYNTEKGQYWVNQQLGEDQSKAFRGNFAGIGMIWDSVNNVFYDAQPYPSWTLNNTTWTWEPPVPKPKNLTSVGPNGGELITGIYVWNEATTTWDLQNI